MPRGRILDLMTAVSATVLSIVAGRAAADSYGVAVAPDVLDEPVSGRLILFFVTGDDPRWMRRAPMTAPFFSRPQPIASVAVDGLAPGGRVTVDGLAVAFPGPLDELDGPVRVQAVVDLDETERSHENGPGNLYSDAVAAQLTAGVDDTVELVLRHRVEPAPPVDGDNLEWVRIRSPILSAFYGRDVEHRAGIALPEGYDAQPPIRASWPAIYVVPAFGGRDSMAARYARAMQRGAGDLPQAVWIFLDPESPLGHHGFVDAPNHGLRGTALVGELIPHLEQRFALDRTPSGRIVTGHSSGGWSALWLQLRWPEVFGGCWASAPDPVDFGAFQSTDLYEDANLYWDEDGRSTPSMRRFDRDGREVVVMTVEQECRMEHAIDPTGGSGQQWDSWEAMFSPADPATGRPRPLFDSETGEIDRAVVEQWRRFDITQQIIGRWGELGPIMLDRVRLVCGTHDSYYLDRAVRRLKETVEGMAIEGNLGEGPRHGYIELIEGATHDTVRVKVRTRWNEEMKGYLRARGLHE